MQNSLSCWYLPCQSERGHSGTAQLSDGTSEAHILLHENGRLKGGFSFYSTKLYGVTEGGHAILLWLWISTASQTNGFSHLLSTSINSVSSYTEVCGTKRKTRIGRIQTDGQAELLTSHCHTAFIPGAWPWRHSQGKSTLVMIFTSLLCPLSLLSFVVSVWFHNLCTLQMQVEISSWKGF